MTPAARLLALALLLLALLVPVSAFTAEEMHIAVEENGDAAVGFTYRLSLLERIAVYLRLVAPEQLVESALEGYSGKDVAVNDFTDTGTNLTIERFASVRAAENGTRYATPVLDFTDADAVLEGYWFRPLIQADFSPAVTRVRFPDGHAEEFFEQERIPSVVHVV